MGKKPTRVREITQVRTRHIRDYKPQEQVNGHKPLFPEPQEEIPFVPEPDLVLVDTIWRGLLTEEELIPKYEEKTISIPRAHFPLSKLDPISTASVSKKTIFHFQCVCYSHLKKFIKICSKACFEHGT